MVDLYAGLKRTLRDTCGMQITTNASMKMSELLVEMRLFPRGTPCAAVRIFCNAELPDACIVALNHCAKTRYRAEEYAFDLVASSYYPEEGGDMLGDVYKLYANNRAHWLMGPIPNAIPADTAPITGNVTDPACVETLAAAVKARFGGVGATLCTADIGADATSDYNRQEEITAVLNFGQVVCRLLSVAPGGHMVTK